MSYPNFGNLKSIYNNQMDLLLASTGLTTQCVLNFGISKKEVCPNCIYDPALKKSSNKYKNGGPVPFILGKLCPYCNVFCWDSAFYMLSFYFFSTFLRKRHIVSS